MIPKQKKETVKKPSGTSTNKFNEVEEDGEDEERRGDNDDGGWKDDDEDGVVVRHRRRCLGVNVDCTDPERQDDKSDIRC